MSKAANFVMPETYLRREGFQNGIPWEVQGLQHKEDHAILKKDLFVAIRYKVFVWI